MADLPPIIVFHDDHEECDKQLRALEAEIERLRTVIRELGAGEAAEPQACPSCGSPDAAQTPAITAAYPVIVCADAFHRHEPLDGAL